MCPNQRLDATGNNAAGSQPLAADVVRKNREGRKIMSGLLRLSVLTAAIAVLLGAGCSKPESPGEAVQNAYAASQQGDVDAVWQRMSEADHAKFMSGLGVTDEEDAKQALREEFAEQPHHHLTIGDIQTDGDSAIVTATMYRTPDDATGETATIRLIKENSRWVLNDN